MVDQLYAEQNKRDLLICEGRHRIGLTAQHTTKNFFTKTKRAS